MKKLTVLGTAALSLVASTPALALCETGPISLFVIDDHPFAWTSGDTSVMVCLSGDLGHSFKVVGVAGGYDYDIMFVDATIGTTGIVTKLPGGDFVPTAEGDTDLVLPLAETLALMATAGLGSVYKTNLALRDDATMFMVNKQGSTDLTIFTIGDEMFGVHGNPDCLHVVSIDEVGDDFRAVRILGTFQKSVLAAAVTTERVHQAA